MIAPPSSRPQQMSGADAYREAMRLDALGRYGEAQKLCQQILKVAPNHPDVLHLLGVVFTHAGRLDDAIRHFKLALKAKPNLAEAATNLAKVFARKENWRELIGVLQDLRKLQPESADILVELGLAHEKTGDVDAAMAFYRDALQFDPDSALAHSNLGAILTRQGLVDAAETHLNKALASANAPPAAYLNMAMLHEVAGRPDEAVNAYDAALTRDPDNAVTHHQRAMTLLSQGRFEEGWREYGWRFRKAGAQTMHAQFPQPFWNGEPLAGRKLLVWTEQGPGDEILLASMIPDAIAQGAELTLVCSQRLVPLFQRSFSAARVVANNRVQKADTKDCDFQASFSHLGAALRPSFESFPAQLPYLIAKAALRDKLRATYTAGGRKVVGIAWHSANPTAEKQKSVGLESWGPILRTPTITFVSLQYGDHEEEIEAARKSFGCEIVTDTSIDSLKSIDAFTAQVAAMDHVVSVSNTTAHVAGGLGIPTSVLVPKAFGKIWYWFLNRSHSPWYPSVTLFRQRSYDDWSETIADVARNLA